MNFSASFLNKKTKRSKELQEEGGYIEAVYIVPPSKEEFTHLEFLAFFFCLHFAGLFQVEVIGIEGCSIHPEDRNILVIPSSRIERRVTLRIFFERRLTSMKGAFSSCLQLVYADLTHLDTSLVTSFEICFTFCYNLLKVNGEGCITRNVTNMSRMFQECYQLATITGVESWDTRRVQTVDFMFFLCENLVSVKELDWDLRSCTNFSDMFYGCDNLIEPPRKMLLPGNVYGDCRSMPCKYTRL